MKVLHVIPSVASIRGGPSHAILAMVKALNEQNITAEILTTNDNGSDLLDVPLCQRTEYAQVPIWFFPRVSPPLAAIREFAFSLELTTWLWQHISDYDLIHVHAIFSYASTIAMAIARSQNVPYIVRPLGQLCTWSLQQNTHKKQLYLNLIERQNLQQSQALHLTSQQELQEVSQLDLKASKFVLPHGVSLSPNLTSPRQQLRQLLQLPEDQPIILYMSRIHVKKGLDYLIPALGKIKQRFTFVLAGSGSPSYEAEVEQLLIKHEIRDRTYRPGFIKESKTKDLFLQGSDIFVLTSHSENFGIAVVEAMAAGLPVVVTPGVALASEVKAYQTGYVANLNVSEIASAIQQYLNYPKKAKEMGDRARQLIAQKYTWERIALNLADVYKAILNHQPLQINYEYNNNFYQV